MRRQIFVGLIILISLTQWVSAAGYLGKSYESKGPFPLTCVPCYMNIVGESSLKCPVRQIQYKCRSRYFELSYGDGFQVVSMFYYPPNDDPSRKFRLVPGTARVFHGDARDGYDATGNASMACAIQQAGLPNPGWLVSIYHAANGFVGGYCEVIMEEVGVVAPHWEYARSGRHPQGSRYARRAPLGAGALAVRSHSIQP